MSMSISLCYVISLAVSFFQITDVQKTLRPFRVSSHYKFDPRLSFFLNPRRTYPEAHLLLLLVRYQVVPLPTDLSAPDLDASAHPRAL